MAPIRFIREPDQHRMADISRQLAFSGGRQAGIADIVRFRSIEHEVDRIQRDDRREQSGVGPSAFDEVAYVDAMIGNPAGNRGSNLGPFEVQLGVPHCGFGPKLFRSCHAELRFIVLQLALPYDACLDQLLSACDVVGSDLHLRPGPRHVGLCTVDRDLERPWIDDEQQIALLARSGHRRSVSN